MNNPWMQMEDTPTDQNGKVVWKVRCPKGHYHLSSSEETLTRCNPRTLPQNKKFEMPQPVEQKQILAAMPQLVEVLPS